MKKIAQAKQNNLFYNKYIILIKFHFISKISLLKKLINAKKLLIRKIYN